MFLNQNDKLRWSPDPNLNCGSGVSATVWSEIVANLKLRPLSGQGERKINDGMLLAAEVGIVDTAGEVEADIADGSGEALKEVELERNSKAMSVGDEVKTRVDGVLDEVFRVVEPETATLMASSQLFSLDLKLDLDIRCI